MAKKIKYILQKFKEWIILASFLVVFFFCLSFTEKSNKNLQVKNIVINIKTTEEKSFSNVEQISNLLKSYAGNEITGHQFNSLNIQEIENKLREIPYFKNAEIFYTLSGNLYCEVEEKSPLFRVQPKNGTGFYVDKDGGIIPLSNEVSFHKPLLSGYVSQADLKPTKPIFRLMNLICNDPFFSDLMGQVHLSRQGKVVLVPKAGFDIIEFGSCHHLESRLQKIKVAYQQLLPSRGWKKYHSLNVEYKGQIILK